MRWLHWAWSLLFCEKLLLVIWIAIGVLSLYEIFMALISKISGQ